MTDSKKNAALTLLFPAWPRRETAHYALAYNHATPVAAANFRACDNHAETLRVIVGA